MNLKPYLFALSLLAAAPATAQYHAIGFQAGIGRSGMRSEVFEDQRLQARPGLGLTYEHSNGRHKLFSIDLLYQQRGFSDSIILADRNMNPIGTATAEFRYSYLALPVQLGYTFGRRAFGFGKIGIVPAVLLKATVTAPDVRTRQELSYDATGDVVRLDVGGIVEAGGGYRFGERYEVYGSLSFRHSANWTYSAFSSRQYGSSLSAGFRYRLPARRETAVPASN